MSNENLYRRGSVYWLRTSVAGRELRESLRCCDLKTARQRRDKRIAEIEGAVHFGEVKHTWEEAVTEWAQHAIGQVSRTTAKRYAVSLKQCGPFLVGSDVKAIDGKTIQHLVNQRRNVDKATPATIRRDLTAISRVLEYAEALEWREGNPTLSKRKLLRERRDPITLPTSQDIDTVCASASHRFSSLIRSALLTGCRQDELVNLTWKHFNAKTGTLEVIGKGNKRRTIQLSESAAAHLMAQPYTLGSELIFCTDKGTKWTSPASNFGRIARSVAAKNKGFRRFRFHDLRHLYAVEALRGGMGLYALSKHLGHTSVQVTERVYLTFLTPEEAQAAKDKAA